MTKKYLVTKQARFNAGDFDTEYVEFIKNHPTTDIRTCFDGNLTLAMEDGYLEAEFLDTLKSFYLV